MLLNSTLMVNPRFSIKSGYGIGLIIIYNQEDKNQNKKIGELYFKKNTDLDALIREVSEMKVLIREEGRLTLIIHLLGRDAHLTFTERNDLDAFSDALLQIKMGMDENINMPEPVDFSKLPSGTVTQMDKPPFSKYLTSFGRFYTNFKQFAMANELDLCKSDDGSRMAYLHSLFDSMNNISFSVLGYTRTFASGNGYYTKLVKDEGDN